MFDVWKNVSAILEKNIPSSSFQTWFLDVSLYSIDNGHIIIEVPNVFKQKQLQTKYVDDIITAFKANNIDVVSIEFKITSEKKRKVVKSREVQVGSVVDDLKNKIAAGKGTSSNIVVNEPPKERKRPFSSNLSNLYTFDNFVVGKNNEHAAVLAQAIVKQPGTFYNPFFLYGGSGLGKTHLVQAIGNAITKEHPELKVLYTSTSHFYSEFIDSIKKRKTEDFQKKYQSIDVLIIDDFQMIINKDASQEEFFNIFNDMYLAQKQIIITSDRLPDQIKTVDKRLASRLAWSGPIDLQMPSFEDRCAILRSMADYKDIYIENEAIEEIANSVKTNIRDLEGQFRLVTSLADLKNCTPLEMIQSGILNTTNTKNNNQKPLVNVNKLIETVAKHCDITVSELRSKSRVSNIKTARQIAMYLLSTELNLSSTKIAEAVGVKDHTTVMHGKQKIKDDIQVDYALRDQVEMIRENLYA